MVDQGRDARLVMLAGRQAGAFSRQQALDLGYPDSTVADRLQRSTWQRLHPGVYAIGGTPRCRALDLWAAVLAAGRNAVVTHESGALLHGAERLPLEPITLTNAHGRHHRLQGVFVHQIDDLRSRHTCWVGGLRVSSPARVVVELGATQRTPVVGRVTDDLLRMRKTTMAEIAAVFGEIARPGKPGMACIAEVLDERSDGYVPPHSELERLLFDVLDAGGLPPPVRQIPLPGRGRIRGIADAGYLDAKILMEADGRRWHDRVGAARLDRERDAQAARAGWLTLRFVFEQLVDAPAEVCTTVEDVRRVRLNVGRRAA
jgi:hypothetical protein